MSVSAPRSGPRMLHRSSGIVAASLVVVVLGGCVGLGAAPASVALSEAPGFPADAPIADPLADPLADPNWVAQPVGWLAADRATITIVSYWSSSCPLVATAIEVFDDATLEIELRPPSAQACTDDLAPRTHVLAVPEGWGRGDGPYIAAVARVLDAFGTADPYIVDVTVWPWPASQTIAVETTRGVPDDVTLLEGSLDKGDPLAFWGARRESLRVITWGSSSCPPPALTLEAVSASELAVVFGALPPVACTADFAPTTHVLAVPAELDSGAVTLEVTIKQRDTASLQYSVPIAD